jgi:hypothetical protein
MKNFIVFLVLAVTQLGIVSRLDAGLTFTAVPGLQVGNSLPVQLFANATPDVSVGSIDIGTIQLSAGALVQTSPTSSIPGYASFGSLTAGTIGSANVNPASYLAFDPGTDPKIGGMSITYIPAQPFTSMDGLIASWIIDTTGIVGPTVGLSLSGVDSYNSVGGQLTFAFTGGNGMGDYTFNLTAVPEPTSLLAGTTLGFFGVMYRRRRRAS